MFNALNVLSIFSAQASLSGPGRDVELRTDKSETEVASAVDIVDMLVVVLAPKTQNVHGALLVTCVWSKPLRKSAFLSLLVSFLSYYFY